MGVFRLVLAALLVLCILTVSSADNRRVDYPENYRQWNHVKSMLIEPGHPLENPFQGLHHIYANDKALPGFKNGSFENGSIIVFDLLQYKKEGKMIQEQNRKLVGVMQKDAKKYKLTGGWGFEGFAQNSGSKRLTQDGGKSCFSCHESQMKSDFVFSKLRK